MAWWLLGVAFAGSCPTFRAELAGVVGIEALPEASGLVASGRDPARLWSHNDSGNAAELIAMGLDGALQGIWPVAATALDWEDVARRGDELLVGDIGDNRGVRPHVSIWVVAEPVDGPGEPLAAREIRFTYEDGPRDAEVLLVEPGTGRLLVLSKGRESEHAIYAVPEQGGVAVRVGEVPWVRATPYRTAGDVAPDGSAVILRGYTFGWWYPVPASGSVVDALVGEPCPFPTVPEAQGESVAFGPDGMVYTVSETVGQPLWRYRRVP